MTVKEVLAQAGFAPAELRDAIAEFFPPGEIENALAVSYLESWWDAFTVNDTTTPENPCGSVLAVSRTMSITAEKSVGYFQINVCNFPDWEWQRLYNARHNVGTAHMLWDQAGQSWSPWYFSAQQLGLI